MKLYREVKASERLPDSLKVVTAYDHDDTLVDLVFYNGYNKIWYSVYALDDNGNSSIIPEPESWLDPISITEEEKKQAASDYEKIACCDKDDLWLKIYVNEDFEAGVNWALSKLKGDE